MDQIDFKTLAHQLMFDLSDDEVKDIENEFNTLLKQMDLMNAIDTDGVEPQVYCFEDETTFIRDDEVSNVFTQKQALANAPKVRDGHFVVPKVVK